MIGGRFSPSFQKPALSARCAVKRSRELQPSEVVLGGLPGASGGASTCCSSTMSCRLGEGSMCRNCRRSEKSARARPPGSGSQSAAGRDLIPCTGFAPS